MSVWKKTSKANQKTHRERHQPESRNKFGLLEKKKDYVRRAKDHNAKQRKLHSYRKKALDKNPDEFYHHMIRSRLKNGVHCTDPKKQEHTKQQLLLMQTQDLSYVGTKRNAEQKKVNQLQSQLHLMDMPKMSRRTKFVEDDSSDESSAGEETSHTVRPKIPASVADVINQSRASSYKMLSDRCNRLQELTVAQQKMELQRRLATKRGSLPPRKLKRATASRPATYQWVPQRKK